MTSTWSTLYMQLWNSMQCSGGGMFPLSPYGLALCWTELFLALLLVTLSFLLGLRVLLMVWCPEFPFQPDCGSFSKMEFSGWFSFALLPWIPHCLPWIVLCLHYSFSLQLLSSSIWDKFKNGCVFKVSVTLQHHLHADHSSFCCFYEKPFELYIFWRLNNSRKWLFIQKEAKV